ncbi:MAG: hypothetical protein CR972_04690 [Candidatus Moraniibacteriota bacterium]|nr:MAG: hypothetical protein CR972_04690 [Candidatus Moranbacteria bacterium]
MNAVSKTLYIPLLGNVRTSKLCPALFYDPKALALEKDIPASLRNKKAPKYFYFAGAARYFTLDREVKKFIADHPQCNIINLGAGLDTTFYRIGSTTATFYELDLAPVIAKRRELLGEEENDVYIEGSFLDVVQWTEKVADKTKPTLMIASGLFYYFPKEQVSQFLRDMKGKFAHAELVFDCVNEKGMNISNKFVKKTGNLGAPMYFFIDDIKEYLREVDVNITLVEEYMLYRDAKRVVRKSGFYLASLIMYLSDKIKRVKIEHLRID